MPSKNKHPQVAIPTALVEQAIASAEALRLQGHPGFRNQGNRIKYGATAIALHLQNSFTSASVKPASVGKVPALLHDAAGDVTGVAFPEGGTIKIILLYRNAAPGLLRHGFDPLTANHSPMVLAREASSETGYSLDLDQAKAVVAQLRPDRSTGYVRTPVTDEF